MNFSLLIQNEIALERQLVNILNTNFNPYSTGKGYYNFRCNICGDSKKSKVKRRGYLIKKKDKPWYFYCHNCQASLAATKWIKEYFPLHYKDYIREILSNKEKAVVKKSVVQKINKDDIPEKDDIKFFVPIYKGKDKIFETAIKFCEKRSISRSIWSKWFVAVDGKYKNRLIISFYDDNNKIYFWQGRALKDWMLPKYMSRLGDQFNNIYNYYNVDKKQEVIILEGCIDSEFVENSIGLTGLKIHDKRIEDFKNRYFLFDSDKDGKKKSLKLLEKGEYVFNWSKYIRNNHLPKREKWDINDLYIYLERTEDRIDKFFFEDFEDYFTNSIYDKVDFII